MKTTDIATIIREHCPVFTKTLTNPPIDIYMKTAQTIAKNMQCDSSNTQLETDHLEPRCLGDDNTRRLYTHVYGMSLNGYTDEVIASNVRSIFRIDIDTMDIHHIIESIEFESALASRTLLP